jgi:hypothetical protein
MALIKCSECGGTVSDAAASCPACGHPVRPVPPPRPAFAGPPVNCRHCGGQLKTEAKATSQGTGCLLIVLGLVLTPVLIGIPLVLYGIHLGSKREGLWRCRKCEATFPRVIKWYQMG